MQYENVNKYDVKKWKLQRGSYVLGEGPSGYVSRIECMANICVDFHHPAMLYLVHTHTHTNTPRIRTPRPKHIGENMLQSKQRTDAFP